MVKELRTVKFGVPFKPSEFDVVKAAAEQDDMTTAAWIRRCVLQEARRRNIIAGVVLKDEEHTVQRQPEIMVMRDLDPEKGGTE